MRTARISYNLNRWFGLRIDLLGSLFTVSLAAYLVYSDRPVGAANAGFSLNMCIDFCTMVMWLVRNFNNLEVQANRWVNLCFLVRVLVRSFPCPVLNESNNISTSSMNQKLPTQASHQLRGPRVGNCGFRTYLRGILRYLSRNNQRWQIETRL